MPETIQVKGFPARTEKKVTLPLMAWTIPLKPATLCFLASFKRFGSVF